MLAMLLRAANYIPRIVQRTVWTIIPLRREIYSSWFSDLPDFSAHLSSLIVRLSFNKKGNSQAYSKS